MNQINLERCITINIRYKTPKITTITERRVYDNDTGLFNLYINCTIKFPDGKHKSFEFSNERHFASVLRGIEKNPNSTHIDIINLIREKNS